MYIYIYNTYQFKFFVTSIYKQHAMDGVHKNTWEFVKWK